MAAPDTHITIVPYLTVPEGRMEEFKKDFSHFYRHTREGTMMSGECLYYGFAMEGNTVFCREGYRSAEGALAHLAEVKEELKRSAAICGSDGMNFAVMGPAAELEKLKEALEPLGTKFYALDEGAMAFHDVGQEVEDSHVTVLPYFTVPEGKLEEFKKHLPAFYRHTKNGTKECLYYGFAISGNTVFCREGYRYHLNSESYF